MEATYTITWDEELGSAWMNLDNLKACLFGETCIGGEAIGMVNVEEVGKTETP